MFTDLSICRKEGRTLNCLPKTMKLHYTYDHYYLYDEMTAVLERYARDYPEFVRLTSLTATAGGREMWILSLTDLSTGDYEEKPGLLIEGNIHADEIIGSMCILYYIDHLLSGKDEDPKIARMLRDYTVYAIPRICPDGTEYAFTGDWTCKSNTRLYPFTSMPEGVIPKDLDGDGHVRKMRIRDPKGEWKINPEDPRMFIHREPDDIDGEFYTVVMEGIVNGDIKTCLYDAPNPYTRNYNRNFPYLWRPDSHLNRIDQFGSGEYPMCDPEVKAIVDFTVSHSNLCSFVDFHSCLAMILAPEEIACTDHGDKKDEKRYAEIISMGQSVTGFNTNLKPGPKSGFVRLGGDSSNYMHFCRGIFALGYEACGQRLEARLVRESNYKDKADNDIRMLKWLDDHGYGEDVFKPWTPFRHPQLGEVEIGGIEHKTIVMNPAEDMLLDEAEKAARFLDRIINTMPVLEMKEVTVNKLSGEIYAGNTYEVLATVANNRYLPTYVTEEAISLNLISDIEITLGGTVENVIVGERTMSLGQLDGTSNMCGGSMFGYASLMSGKKPDMEKTARWVIKAQPGEELMITAISKRAGIASGTVCIPE